MELQLLRFGKQQRKRLLDGLQANGFSVTGKVIFRDGRASLRSNGNIDEPDGLFVGAAARTGNTCYGNGEIDAQGAHGTCGHFQGGFGRNRTLFSERFGVNAEELFLNAVVIRDDTAVKYGGSARDIGNEGRNKTSGTAFSRTEGYFFLNAL